MVQGWNYYPCKCGGEIHEEWTNSDTYVKCDRCKDPVPADVEVSQYFELDEEELE